MAAEGGRVVTVAGASGLLGGELLKVLRELAFPVGEVRPVRDSVETPGADEAEETEVEFDDQPIDLIDPSPKVYEGADLAFFAGSSDDAGNAAKLSIARVPLSVDLSGRFADNTDVPLVLAEVNAAALGPLPPRALLAVPDAATAIVALALAPLHRAFGVRRAIVSTYESASGLGRPGMDELGKQIRALFNYQSAEPALFPRPLAFNAIPQVAELEADGRTRAEHAMTRGLARLLDGLEGAPAGAPQVIATRVWVPVFSGHSASITLETEKPLTLDEARRVLVEAPAVEVSDDPEEGEYPVNGEALGGDDVAVGRLRVDGDRTLSLWVTADNLRRGAAIAGVKLAEAVLSRRG